ncbi:DUF3224 domain-containing protein [Pseudonocardia sp. GCM10023141]|uniref:DUF3224 domain-containing protein n=1 Tax=Pseudonocardia sp. GCM10023141 TaxID=3252653 RepID=UPI0036119261
MTTTTGRFDLPRWDEEVYDDAEGAKLVRVSSAKVFEGGITGTSEVQILQAFAQEGAAAYVAIERVTAAVDGSKGTFVLMHAAVGSAAGGSMDVSVVPNSGTGELSGLTGSLVIARAADGEHTYTFDYALD